MIEQLVLARAPVGWDRLVPFVGIVELRIDVEDHATKRVEPVANNLTNLEFGDACLCHVRGDRPGLRPILVPRTRSPNQRAASLTANFRLKRGTGIIELQVCLSIPEFAREVMPRVLANFGIGTLAGVKARSARPCPDPWRRPAGQG